MFKRFSKIISCCVIFGTLLSGAYASNFWNDLWGTTPENQFYLGMWTLHLNPSSQRSDNYVNNLIGVEYHSFFVATFTNSFHDQTYTFGLQRNWYTHQFQCHPDLLYTLGYRVGGIYGYDSRLMHLAGQTPVIPFLQLVSDLSYKRVGWEVTYTGIVVSTSFFVRF